MVAVLALYAVTGLAVCTTATWGTEDASPSTSAGSGAPPAGAPDAGGGSNARSEGDSPRRGAAGKHAFAVGDPVTVKYVPPTDHTRLPGNLRGRTGTVERVFEGSYGYFCFTGPDGIGEPMPVYIVRFEPADIWGELARARRGALRRAVPGIPHISDGGPAVTVQFGYPGDREAVNAARVRARSPC